MSEVHAPPNGSTSPPMGNPGSATVSVKGNARLGVDYLFLHRGALGLMYPTRQLQ